MKVWPRLTQEDVRGSKTNFLKNKHNLTKEWELLIDTYTHFFWTTEWTQEEQSEENRDGDYVKFLYNLLPGWEIPSNNIKQNKEIGEINI